MKANMGSADRIIRVLIAVAIAIFYFTGQLSGVAAIVLMVLAVIFLLTGLLKFCPLYWPFGISTCKRKS